VFAIIQIPAIGVHLVEGVGREDLHEGPGHVPSTVLPGEPGAGQHPGPRRPAESHDHADHLPPRYSARQRLIVCGDLTSTVARRGTAAAAA
jgi:hypothetical protein